MEDNDGRNEKGECRESYNKYIWCFVAVVPGKVVETWELSTVIKLNLYF